MPIRVLAVSDEVRDVLWRPAVRRLRPQLVVAAGDLPFDYLEYLMTACNAPLAFVPGNHDPELAGFRVSRAGLSLRAGLPVDPPPPAGGVNVDARVEDVGGLRVAGLGGSLRYRPGANQYTQKQFARRARRVRRAADRRRRRDGRGVEILLSHAPPLGLGDEQDKPHQGIEALHELVGHLRPRYLLHGHIHPYGMPRPDRQLGDTTVVNVVGYKLIEIADPDEDAESPDAGAADRRA